MLVINATIEIQDTTKKLEIVLKLVTLYRNHQCKNRHAWMYRDDTSKIVSQKSHKVERLNYINPKPRRNGEIEILIVF